MDRTSIVFLDSLKNEVRFQMSYVMYNFIREACVLYANKYKSYIVLIVYNCESQHKILQCCNEEK